MSAVKGILALPNAIRRMVKPPRPILLTFYDTRQTVLFPHTAVTAARLGVGLIEEAQFLFNAQPVDAAPPFGQSMQAGALPSGFEHFLALGVVDPLADKDGGDGSSGTVMES